MSKMVSMVVLIAVFTGMVYAALPDGVWIHFSGGMRGALDPCGCKIPMGGIARRIGAIEKMEKIAYTDAHFYVDAGEWRELGDPYDGGLKTAALLNAMKVGPLVAVNVSLRDLMFDRGFIDSLANVDSIPFVSANIRVDSIQAPVFPAYRVAHGKVGKKQVSVGFIGLTDPQFTRLSNRRQGIIALDWTLILRDVLSELKKEKVDAVVLLTDASPTRIDTLMAGTVGVQLIISSSSEFVWDRVDATPVGYTVAPIPTAKHWEAVKSTAKGPQPWVLSTTELTGAEPESPIAAKLVAYRKARFHNPPAANSTLPNAPAPTSPYGGQPVPNGVQPGAPPPPAGK